MRRSVELGVPVVIDSDAYSVAEVEQIEFGVRVAPRGWAQPADIINTWPLDRILERLRG